MKVLITGTYQGIGKAIAKEYDGSNVRQLARKYGLSDRHIRTILQEAGMRKSS